MKEEYNLVHVLYLASVTLLLVAFLNTSLMDSTLGASLYIGYCFFVAVISLNKKCYKQKKTEKKRYNSGD